MMNEIKKIYLGDGLYGRFDGYQIELFTSNGLEEMNHVFLEPGTLGSFLRWIEHLKEKPTCKICGEDRATCKCEV